MMKTGRNEPCPCGSGKKYKKCCLAQDEAKRLANPPAVETGAPAAEPGQEAPEETKAPLSLVSPTPFLEVEEPEGSEWDESEEFDDWEEEAPEAQEVKYPRPNQKLPKLPPDQEKLVEEWWEKTEPLYEQMQIDPLLQRVEMALTELPELFVHLGLDQELFFFLGDAMARAGRMSEYIGLLKRLRREQRRMYSFAYGAFDMDVIGDLVVNHQSEEIPAYLDFFKEYPDAEPDYGAYICELLGWRGLAEPLFLLCETVAAPMLLSNEVLDGNFALRWLIWRSELPFLEAGEASAEAVGRLVEDLKQMGERLEFPLDPEAEELRADLEASVRGPRLKKDHAPDPKGQRALAIHFAASLHRSRNTPWVEGLFLGDLLANYCRWSRREKRPWLRLTKKDIDAFVGYASRGLLGCTGVKLLGALQTLVWFAEYAQAAQLLPASEGERITRECRELFEIGRKAVDPTDPAYRICPEFDRLIGASRRDGLD